MKSKEDFRNVLAVVSEVSEIDALEIFSSRKSQEYTDARWITIELLTELGYYPNKISALTGLSVRSVTKVISEIQSRRGKSWKMLRRNLEECRTLLGIISEAEN